MLKKYGILAIAVIGCALSCVQKEEKGIERVTFQAVHADSPASKTVLQADGSVFWSTGDAINLFYGEGGAAKLTSANKDAAAQTTFTGTLDGMLPNGTDEFWAVYPYAAGNSFDGSAVTLTLPAEQTGVAGTFANNLFISLARSKDYTLQFYNLCGGIKFSVAQQGIQSVVFQGNDGEILAGQVQVAFDDNGKPAVKELVKGATELRLSAPEGGFEVGKWYYIVSLPDTLSAGYTMVFLDANSEVVAQRVTDTPVTIKRSVWGRLTNADEVVDPSNNYIYYTSTDGKVVEPTDGASFGSGVNIVSNTYENGQGVIQFDGPVTRIGEYAFRNASQDARLKTVVLPESCLTIGSYAFDYQSSLEEVQLPGGLQSIGSMAFYGCRALTGIEFPESLISLGDYIFCYCELLHEVTIPQSLETMQGGVFAACTGLTRFYGKFADATGRALINGGTLLAFAPSGLSTYTVPDGVTSIAEGVFSDFSNMAEIILPDGLQSIGMQAFSSCTGLTEMIIPESVTSIGNGAFRSCSNLTSVNIPLEMTTIPTELFSSCTSLPEITIPEGVTTIGGFAFSSCLALHSVIVPSAVQSVGRKAFGYATALESLVFESPNPPTGDEDMFIETNNCPIYVPAQSVDAYKAAEYWSNYADRIYPIGTAITASKYLTFTSEGLTVISIENVGGNAPVLYYSDDLDTWTQWEYDTLHVKSTRPIYICGDNSKGFSLTSSKYSTFTASGDPFGVSGDIMSLVNKDTDLLVIPNGSCFERLFLDCTLLTSAPTLPATSLANYCYYQLFSGCTSLTVAPELPATSVEYGCYNSMFSGCTSLIEAPALPATALSGLCYQEMFKDCTSLTVAPELPATTAVDHCYTGMFEGCTSLTTAPQLPATTLNTYCYQTMFDGCSSLAEAPELPATTLARGCYNMMFSNCSQLTMAPELPAATLVEWCYSQMFYECSSLNYVKCLATDISAENCVYWWLNGVATQGLFIKAGAMKDWPTGSGGIPNGWTVEDEVQPTNEIWYTSTTGEVIDPYDATVFGANLVSNTYENGKGIITFDGPVTGIGESAFLWTGNGNAYKLLSISLPETVTTIGSSAFFQCRYLTQISIPDGVTSIGYGAFLGCNTLPEIHLPTSLQTIGSEAFLNCSELTTLHIPDDVTSIGTGAFAACNNLSSFTGKYASADSRCLIVNNSLYAFAPFGLTTYTVPDGVVEIKNEAFRSHNGLEEVVFPEGLLRMGGAFTYCNGLKRVTIPSSVSNIYSVLIDQCTIEEGIYVMPVSPPTAPNGVPLFRDSNEFPIYVPAASLEDYKAAAGWSDFADRIFAMSEGAQPNNEIWYTSTTGEAVIPADNAYFGADLVSNTYENGKGVITFDGDVTTIGDDAFWTSNQEPGTLKTISLPESCTSIGMSAFQFQSAIEEFGFPETLQSIGALAFYGCTALPSVSLYNTLTEIGDFAFGACDSLKQVAIPHTVQVMGNSVFAECKSLERFDGKYADETGRALINGNKLLAIAPAGLTTYTIPDGVTIIGGSVFKACANFLEINIPEGVTQINMVAFDGCTGLSSITIPSSMQSLGGNAFSNCTGLESIFVMATNPPAGGNNMFDSTNECPIFVPSQSLADYQAATYWNLYSERIQGMQ